MQIVIAGGGLVGLTAAASLRQDGHDVTVVEQAPEIRAVGAGIGLWSNALRELDRIGIGREIGRAGHVVDAWFFTPEGRRVRAPGHTDEDYRFVLVPRPRLNALLADAVGRENIRLGAHLDHYEETDDAVTVVLSDGNRLTADLLVGADGVYSRIRTQLAPGSVATPHRHHIAWRAIVPAGDEQPEGTVLTIGTDGTRGGYSRIDDDHTMWMVNQFDAGDLVGGRRDRALVRARNLADRGWHDDLLRMIARTPEDVILENQIMLVPALPTWSSARVTLIGDAAHGLSPHLSAGGTLGIEDVGVLRRALGGHDLKAALQEYQQARIPRFAQVRGFSDAIERATDAEEFAGSYARFSHWMTTTA